MGNYVFSNNYINKTLCFTLYSEQTVFLTKNIKLLSNPLNIGIQPNHR